jgi:hypothetical protein
MSVRRGGNAKTVDSLSISLGPFHWKRLADVPGAKAFRFNASPEPGNLNIQVKSIIANDLGKAGWSLGCVATVDARGRIIWTVDAHRDNGKINVIKP